MATGLDRQIEYWNGAGKTKSFTIPLRADRFEAYVDKSARIVDFGCGYGRTLNDLHEIGYENILGLDPAEAMIRRGKSAFPHLDLRLLHGSSIPFEDCTCDVVVLFAVLTCIVEDQGQIQIVDEIFRVLRPGGILHVSDFPLQHDARNIDRYNRFMEKYGIYGIFELPDGAVLRHLDPDWFEELTRRLECLDRFELDVMTMNGNPARAFQYFGRKVDYASETQ